MGCKKMSNPVRFTPSDLMPEHDIVLLKAGFCPNLNGWQVPKIRMPCWVMWYNQSPGCSCISGGMEYELTGRNVILIPPYTEYEGIQKHPVRHYFFWFQTAAPFDLPRREVVELDAAPFASQLEQAFRSPAYYRIRLYCIVTQILLSIPESFFDNAGNNEKSQVINKVLDFINQHHGNVTNAEIAAAAYLSSSRLSHLFKAEMGFAPQRYCRQLRMMRAMQLLLDGMGIKEVAEKCGFANRYHFSKDFRKYNFAPPGKWLKSHPNYDGKGE